MYISLQTQKQLKGLQTTGNIFIGLKPLLLYRYFEGL